MEEAIRRLWAFVRSLNDRLITVEIQHGETDEITFQDSFPSSPYNNQMILRTDLKPPAGGQLFRYDSLTGTWLRLT